MLDYIYNSINDLHYLGVIGYADQKLINPQPMWIWQKSNTIPEELYNPPIVITNHSLNGHIKFNVFRDDYLIGGTKQRALVDLIIYVKRNNSKITKFIYAGPSTGYAQVALAYCCKLTKTKAVLFLAKPNYINSKGNSSSNRTNLTKYALSQNSTELHEIDNGYLKNLVNEAEKYHTDNKDTSYLLSFGGHEKKYMEFLEKNIRKAMPNPIIKPKRIWIVSGSATILNVLYKIYPKTYFLVVQVGRPIWDDLLDKSRTTLYISNENFNDVAKEQPPYETVSTYDAKLWVFFLKHGKDGDYIWNVGKDINNI